MFVKIYSYRVHPDKVSEMLSVQQRACLVYARHVASRVVLLRHRTDPCRWLEIQWYADDQAYASGLEAVNADPDTAKLWQAFQETLDPRGQSILEEEYEQVWNAGMP